MMCRTSFWRQRILPALASLNPVPDEGTCRNATAMSEQNKSLVRAFVDASNARDWQRALGLLASDFKRQSAAAGEPAVNSAKERVALNRRGLGGLGQLGRPQATGSRTCGLPGPGRQRRGRYSSRGSRRAVRENWLSRGRGEPRSRSSGPDIGTDRAGCAKERSQ
jgi:hypothetical protein